MASEHDANTSKKKVGVFEANPKMLNRYVGFISHWGHDVVVSASSAEEAEAELAKMVKEKIDMDVAVIDLAPNPELADDETDDDNQTDRVVQAVRETFKFAKIIVIRSIEDVGKDVNTVLDKMDLAGLREGIEQPLPPAPDLP